MTFFDATENKELKLFYARLDDLLKRADGVRSPSSPTSPVRVTSLSTLLLAALSPRSISPLSMLVSRVL